MREKEERVAGGGRAETEFNYPPAVLPFNTLGT